MSDLSLFSKVALVVLVVVIVVSSVFLHRDYNNAKRSCDMKWEGDNIGGRGVVGQWVRSSDSEYMCVWLKDQPYEEIRDTVCHECRHYQIENSYEHFCEE